VKISGQLLKMIIQEETLKVLEKAKSRKQQKFMYAAMACKEDGDCPSDEIKKAADSMSQKEIEDFTEMEESTE